MECDSSHEHSQGRSWLRSSHGELLLPPSWPQGLLFKFCFTRQNTGLKPNAAGRAELLWLSESYRSLQKVWVVRIILLSNCVRSTWGTVSKHQDTSKKQQGRARLMLRVSFRSLCFVIAAIFECAAFCLHCNPPRVLCKTSATTHNLFTSLAGKQHLQVG